MQSPDLTVRIRDLVAAIRAAYTSSTTGLSTAEHDALARAALAELATLAEPRPRVAFRPIVIAEAARPTSSAGSLGDGVCTPADVARTAPPAEIAASTEQRLAEILAVAPQAGETIEVAYARKEQRLCELFATLAPPEAYALHRRLATPAAGDVLAAQFARLVTARRVRLLAFLAGARRRAALRRAS
ncbi:MAG TPA: hypothetical protein VFQ53_15155 [Kofleriaceae bacterium]|nr:hypothetical protein [Kofleriaceae bacterium]